VSSVIFIALRRLRAPLILLVAVFAVWFLASYPIVSFTRATILLSVLALGLVGGPATLEAEAQEVHAEETGLGRRLARVERLVPDRDAGLVDAVLESPDPPGAAPQDRERFRGLGDLEVGAPDRGARRVAPRGHRLERLAFDDRAVAVLGEERPPAPRLGAEGDERVAAGVHERLRGAGGVGRRAELSTVSVRPAR